MDQLDSRWQELIKLTEQEFLRNDQNPGGGVFDPKRQGLRLRGIQSDGGYFTLALTEEQVLHGDLPRIAQEFYKAYRADSDQKHQ